jgi:type I restriction enzyme, S subunit
LTNNWKETTLGEVAEINPSESLKVGTRAKYVAMENLTPFTREIAQYEIKEFKGGSKFRNGDTLLARITPCLENGKTAFVDLLEEDEVAFGSTEFIVIREKKGTTDKSFLFYFATSPRFREEAIKSMTGTSGRQRAPTDSIANKRFSFPSLPEQKAIAAILSSFDDKIELLRRQNKTLESIAQAIFKEWFIEFRIKNEELRIDKKTGLPEGWRIGKLGDIVSHIKENVIPAKNKNEFYLHYSIPAFDSGKKPVIELGEKILSNKYSVKPFSFLVSKLNPSIPRIWTIFHTGVNSICSTEFQVIETREQNYFSLVHCFLNSKYFTREFASNAHGTSGSHQRAKPEDILNIELVIPSKDVNEAFHKIIFPLLNKVNNNYSQIQTLSKVRDALLPKLMKGEIRVKKAQAIA